MSINMPGTPPPTESPKDKREAFETLRDKHTVLKGFLNHAGWKIFEGIVEEQVRTRAERILNTPLADKLDDLLKSEQLRAERLGILLPIALLKGMYEGLELEMDKALNAVQDE